MNVEMEVSCRLLIVRYDSMIEIVNPDWYIIIKP
jgi:hypothetical protein